MIREENKNNISTPISVMFKRNPLIGKLPSVDEWSVARRRAELLKVSTIETIPPKGEMTTPSAKIAYLKLCLRSIFLVSPRHLILLETVDDLLRYGYYLTYRNGIPSIAKDKQSHTANIELNNEGDREANSCHSTVVNINSTTPAICIIGWSGTGKSYSINHVLSLYPQKINHGETFSKKAFTQVVWLKVECPSKALPKSICIAILEALDNLLDTDYASQINNPMSQSKARSITAKALKQYFVGLIVIDEMQNIADQSNKYDFFNFLVELTNTIQASLIFIGTPKMQKLFSKDFRILRRCSVLGSMEWPQIVNESKRGKSSEFDSFMTYLDDFNLTNNPLSKELKDALYDYSQGITDLLIKLYFITQIECIARKEKFNAKAVGHTFKLHFKALTKVINALRKNDLDVLEMYSDLAPSSIVINERIEELQRALDDEFDKKQKRSVDDAVEQDIQEGSNKVVDLIERTLSNVGVLNTMTHEQKILFRQELQKQAKAGLIPLNSAKQIAESMKNDSNYK